MAYNYIIFTCLFVITFAYLNPSRTIPKSWFRNEAFFQSDEIENDQEFEASDRQDQQETPTNEQHHGRVQIKVYRGPLDEHEHFAPYGFWVKQPADDHRK
ncbi:hypothetical protein PGB90_008938 [Kerria lacca]